MKKESLSELISSLKTRKKKVPLGDRVPKALLDELDALAKSQGVSRATLTREALKLFLRFAKK